MKRVKKGSLAHKLLLLLVERPQGVTVVEGVALLGVHDVSALNRQILAVRERGWDVRGYPIGEDRSGRKGRQKVAYRLVGKWSASGRRRARPASDK